MPSDLAQRIQAAVLKSLSVRNRYTDQVTAQRTRSLDQAEKEVAKAILKYRTPAGIDKLATKVFSFVDTNALEFMAQYNLTLAGDVQRELSDGIKRVILQGIVQGKGTDDIVLDLGHVVIYKDLFRQAGTRVFSKAQYRMEMIARTEVLRAHNMGRLKFRSHWSRTEGEAEGSQDRSAVHQRGVG